MDWEQVITIGKIVGAIIAIAGFLGTVIINLRKLVHVYDKMEDLITNNEVVNKKIDYLKIDIKNELKKQEDSAILRKDLLLGVARQILLERFTKVIDAGEVSADERIVLTALYQSYKKNGGNSVIHDMWDVVKVLPTTNIRS